MTRRLHSGRRARSARPVIDAHGHLLVPEANALADGHPGEAADAAAERALFTEADMAANQAQIRRVWPQLTDAEPPTGRPGRHRRRRPDRGADADAPVLGRAGAGGQADDRDQRGRGRALRARPRQAARPRHPPAAAPPPRRPRAASTPSSSSASRASASPPTSTAASSPTRSSTRSGRPPPTSGPWSSSTPGGAASARDSARTSSATPSARRPRSRWSGLHLIFGGALDRHRGLRLLAAHGGGFLPTYIGRSDHAWAERPDARGCAPPPSAYLRRIWYDALVYSPAGAPPPGRGGRLGQGDARHRLPLRHGRHRPGRARRRGGPSRPPT